MINAKTKKIYTFFSVRESKWTTLVIYHREISFTHNQSRRQELFSASLFYTVDLFSLFYQGCDSQESKNQQLKPLGCSAYSTISTVSLITHDNFATKNYFILFFVFLVFVKVPRLLLLMYFSLLFVFCLFGQN